MDETIDDFYYNETDMNKTLKAILGSLFIICIVFSAFYCLYKYAQCQEKREKREKRKKELNVNYIEVKGKFSQEV